VGRYLAETAALKTRKFRESGPSISMIGLGDNSKQISPYYRFGSDVDLKDGPKLATWSRKAKGY
jgi:hypothetical protein